MVKFEQTQMDRTTQNSELFDKKVVFLVNFFKHIVGAILKEISLREKINKMMLNYESKDFHFSLFPKFC